MVVVSNRTNKKEILDSLVSRERWLSESFKGHRNLLKKTFPSERVMTFSSNGDGWQTEEGGFRAIQGFSHKYKPSIYGNTPIKNPGEFISFSLTMGVFVGVSLTFKQTLWNCCPLAFVGLSSKSGQMASYSKFPIKAGITYSQSNSVFEFKISHQATLRFVIDGKIIGEADIPWVGSPYYLYAVGVNTFKEKIYDLPLKLGNCKAWTHS